MINRVLIRIKVVQILYSYLLTEKKFELETLSDAAAKERVFSYNVYMDVLALLVMMSRRIERRRYEYPLQHTRFVQRVQEDLSIQQRLRGKESGSEQSMLADALAEIVETSDVYQGYLKHLKNDSITAEEDMWPELFGRVIFRSSLLNEYFSKRENYTLKGMERAEEMVMSTLTDFMGSQDSLPEGLKTLERSLDKSRELYFRLLALAVDLTDLQDRKLDDGRHKLLKTNKELFPNLKFVENKAIEAMKYNAVFSQYIDSNKLYWYQEDPLLMENLLKSVVNSEVYKNYMDNPERSLEEDCELWRELFKKVILTNENFLESLEEKSVFWNDDLDIISTFVLKTFRRIEDGESSPILDKYKDEEDAKFGGELMRYVYKDRETYESWISEAVKDSDWDAERLAFMDKIVVMTALAEIMHFPKIPLKVSINEYIEVAKSYGSAKSGSFVHGLLSDILGKLKEDGLLSKRG